LAGTASHDPRLRYPGQWDADNVPADTTELHSNGYRWYRGDWGRYSQPDPVSHWILLSPLRHLSPSLPIDLEKSLFEYTRSNPSGYSDRLGLSSCCPSHHECASGWWTVVEASAELSGGLPWSGIVPGVGGGFKVGTATLRCLTERRRCDYSFWCYLGGMTASAAFSASAGVFGLGNPDCTCATDYEGVFWSGEVGGGEGIIGGGGTNSWSDNDCWQGVLTAGVGVGAYGRGSHCTYSLIGCWRE
jgi:RHS repeat-associated protein